ncbi:hypothetical protein KGF54_003176 [Candida jiufengensis]|uniref:uncharacterized protein n=1 Tax=Candida jiufengensis TaxID=497108 RepID=UPI0022258C19|nr:uncharacterized protein KGF54_003176 [Candida jiufengensis]KAI5952310.1 hypothetical protein KGF54_003176 [Candida jiufengensis]
MHQTFPDSIDHKCSNLEEPKFKIIPNVEHIIYMVSQTGPDFREADHIVSQLSFALTEKGYNVGILEINFRESIYVHEYFVCRSKVHRSNDSWIPQEVLSKNDLKNGGSLKLISTGLIKDSECDLNSFRGIEKKKLINQLTYDVVWSTDQPLNFLLITTPAGSFGESHLMEETKHLTQLDGAIVVINSESVGTSGPNFLTNFCKKNSIKILGIIEDNRNKDTCNCGCCTGAWSIEPIEGISTLCEQLNINLLGAACDVRDWMAPADYIDEEHEKECMINYFTMYGDNYIPMQDILAKLIELNYLPRLNGNDFIVQKKSKNESDLDLYKIFRKLFAQR